MRRRDAAEEIHRALPAVSQIRPSSDIASLTVTKGSEVRVNFANGAINERISPTTDRNSAVSAASHGRARERNLFSTHQHEMPARPKTRTARWWLTRFGSSSA